MIQKKYNSRLNKIKYPEWVGSGVCLLAAIYIGFHFGQLYNIYVQITGILAILLLLAVPILSLVSFSGFNVIGDSGKPHAEILRQFAVQKLRFQKLQRININLSSLLLVCIIVLISKSYRGRHVSNYYTFWAYAFPIGYIYMSFMVRMIKKAYGSVLRQAEELLKELDA